LVCTFWLCTSLDVEAGLCNPLSKKKQQYVEEILERTGMLNCKPATTLVDTKAKVSAVEGTPLTDKTFYRSIAGALQ
jgi:hypothetical protein